MIVNMNKLLNKPIIQFNTHNLEWTKYIFEECEKNKCPVIIGITENDINYMGGYNVASSLVKNLVKDLNITIPVCLHLDHGKSVESIKKAIKAGFTSVMIDASNYEIEENIAITKKVVKLAHKKNISVEAELGEIGGLYTKVEDAIYFVKKTKIDALAPSIGNKHGLETNLALDFTLVTELSKKIKVPLVLHGGSSIPYQDLKKLINCGIKKININTDLQLAFSKSLRTYIMDNDVYDIRKIISSGETSIKRKIDEIIGRIL